MVLVQLSDGGSKLTWPAKTITLNGLIFSTCVACVFFISLATSSYFKVIKSPVFWQFASNNLVFKDVSTVVSSIEGSNANSALSDQKSTALINSLLTTSTSHLEPWVLLKFIKFLSLKSFTTNPVLNLSKPSASVTCKDLVSFSKAVREVITSRLSIRFSRLPISLMVYLLLSNNLILGPFIGSYKNGGYVIWATSIESPTSVGGVGLSAETPFTNLTWLFLLITNLSTLGR